MLEVWSFLKKKEIAVLNREGGLRESFPGLQIVQHHHPASPWELGWSSWQHWLLCSAPTFQLHGYQSNSCMSGHWSREPPVCVTSGCPSPGPLSHGTSSMNEDGSWVVFSCHSGFRLHGPSMLYCKGHNWNSTKPLCRESDMMSSVRDVDLQKPKQHQNLQAALVLKDQQQSHYGTTNSAPKELNLKFSSSCTPSQTLNSEGIKVTNPKVHLEQQIQYANTKVLLKDQTPHHEAQFQEVVEAQHRTSMGLNRESGSLEEEKVNVITEASQTITSPVTQPASKTHQSPTVSSTFPLPSATHGSTSSPSYTTARSAAWPAITKIKHMTPTLLHHFYKSAPPVPGGEKAFEFGDEGAASVPNTSQDNITKPGQITGSSSLDKSIFKYSLSSQPGPVGEKMPTKTTLQDLFSYTLPSSAYSSTIGSVSAPLSTTLLHLITSTVSSDPPSSSPLSSFSASMSSSPGSHQSHTSTLDEIRISGYQHPMKKISRRPVCPFPPVPAHGTFYFRNVENPGPREHRHYIQYACYPGYTLAHGDIHSYCQQGATWSGVTPVCVALTPCSVNNGGCSQLCSHSLHHNQNTDPTQPRTRCRCRPGFTLLDDRQTCRDLNECVEGLHQCKHTCINTFGSFKCGCDDGYQLAQDQTSCTDVDECQLPVAVTGCVFGCVNTPGRFHCQCPPGYILQAAEGDCHDIDECAVNQGLGPCMEQCDNTPGSYRCSCTHGHILSGDGHNCIAECPPGYRKHLTKMPENSTSPTLREECVDINECQEEKCEWRCVNLPGSHRCICPRGYTLHRDRQHCKDINECSRKNGGCSHLCVNHKGGYKCACPSSHRLSPYSWKKCVPRTTVNATS
ncbi:hypothetical protein LDENG_00212540 [Lucifuga dentata]|nr:hypothetical protein LDENG_00212540 [Lucifuga dentata]